MSQRTGDDPDTWLEQVDRKTFNEWIAAYRLRPFGDEQELLARVASILYVIACERREVADVEKLSDLFMQKLMPADWVGRKVIEKQSFEAIEQAVAAKYG